MGIEPFKKPFRTVTTFLREYLGTPMVPDERERKLHNLALNYHHRTEQYDRAVCTGGMYRGCAVPATSHEQSKIIWNARKVFEDILTEAVLPLGFTRADFHRAIRDAAAEAGRPNPINKNHR